MNESFGSRCLNEAFVCCIIIFPGVFEVFLHDGVDLFVSFLSVTTCVNFGHEDFLHRFFSISLFNNFFSLFGSVSFGLSSGILLEDSTKVYIICCPICDISTCPIWLSLSVLFFDQSIILCDFLGIFGTFHSFDSACP